MGNAGSQAEMHLAGHSVSRIKEQKILIDTHDHPVCDAVWDLYKIAVQKFKNVPTLIEWDQDVPAFLALAEEADKARKIIACPS